MSNKKNNVETAQESQATQTVYKEPTGKFVSLEEKKKRREAREQEYQNFRIKALRRRAERMKLSKEDTEKAVEQLKSQLNSPNQYDILLMFNPANAKMLLEALKNESIAYKIMSNNGKKESDGYMFLDGDQEVLDTLREIVPPGTKIHPYVKKKAAILPAKPAKEKKPKKGGAPRTSLGSGERRKRYNVARMSKKNRKEFKKQVKTLKDRWKAQKKASGTTVRLKPKKRSTSLKKASTAIKQAA